jgi:hypothetical protein
LNKIYFSILFENKPAMHSHKTANGPKTAPEEKKTRQNDGPGAYNQRLRQVQPDYFQKKLLTRIMVRASEY